MELHAPGYHFMGPGTHIIDRINRRVQPINKTDFVAMLHDIDYLMGSGDYRWTSQADSRAVSNAGWTPGGILMKVGLRARQILDLPFNNYTDNNQIASSLMYIVKNDPVYAKLFKIHGVNPSDYPDEY